jgi:hypothetical protein
MSFRPARFTDIHRSGPPTTANGVEWTMRISAQPPDEWLTIFQKDPDSDAPGGTRWAVNVQFVELTLSSSPDTLKSAVEHVDERIRRANEGYRRWLTEAHRKGNERREGEIVEADRVRDLNERFKDL